MKDWVEVDFSPDPPDYAERMAFSKPYRTVLCQETITTMESRQVQDEDKNGDPLEDSTGKAVMISKDFPVHKERPVYGEKWVVTDETLQKITMGKYKRTVWELEKKWHRCQEEKKLVIDMLWSQLDDDTQAQMDARTHARLGSTMPLTYHDWTHPVSHFIPYQVPSPYVSLRKVEAVLA